MTTVEEGSVIGVESGSGVLIAPDASKPSLRSRFGAFLAEEFRAQQLRWALWTPVAVGGGCALYFNLKTEPALWLLIMAAMIAVLLWAVARRLSARRIVTFPILVLAGIAVGMGVASLRTHRVDAPIAPALSEPTRIEGWVMDVDSSGQNGARIVIAPTRIAGLSPEETPVRLRATVKGDPPPPGTPVRLFGILNPPPAPASPGAYDFGRNAYFQGMGGVAFALSDTRLALLDEPPWRIRMAMRINATRFALAQRIVGHLGSRTGGVAAAMVTGHETWIQQDDLDAMRDSGLAHILSISGLHMAVVGGFVFFAFRLLIASWPWLALRVSGKKWAAVAGLVAVGCYLIVSGSPPPAERAAMTASIAFAAILLDRQAITMHALAVAALVILLFQPEAIVTPGFQMSFAATAALVALVEVWPRRVKPISLPWQLAIPQRLGRWIFAAAAASLVAGMATGPFAMQHFNRTAMYGLFANLATSPIADFIMMPALALGAALEPLGLGQPFLWVAGKGVDLMLAIGHWTAQQPGAVKTVASAPAIALPISFLGVLFLCLWKGRLRILGLPLALAVLLWPRSASPDLWIGDGGTNAAYRIDKQAVVIRPGVREFAVDLWSRRRGLTLTERQDNQWLCGRFSCEPVMASPDTPVALWWGRKSPDLQNLARMCVSAQVVSVRAEISVLPPECEDRLVLDGVDYTSGGAVELNRNASGWQARWTSDSRGDRPWSQPVRPLVNDSDG